MLGYALALSWEPRAGTTEVNVCVYVEEQSLTAKRLIWNVQLQARSRGDPGKLWRMVPSVRPRTAI